MRHRHMSRRAFAPSAPRRRLIPAARPCQAPRHKPAPQGGNTRSTLRERERERYRPQHSTGEEASTRQEDTVLNDAPGIQHKVGGEVLLCAPMRIITINN